VLVSPLPAVVAGAASNGMGSTARAASAKKFTRVCYAVLLPKITWLKMIGFSKPTCQTFVALYRESGRILTLSKMPPQLAAHILIRNTWSLSPYIQGFPKGATIFDQLFYALAAHMQ
jgi:hypothetical protein